LDAPCSGLGVLRKKPDVRWKKNPQDVEKLQVLQRSLLQKVATLVRKNGTLIYSTCTIEPQENENVVTWFLEQHPEFQQAGIEDIIPKEFITDQGFLRTWPHVHHMDGSFAAKLIKRS
jgi:16S rRNA (cytosine967-C5)-methyltransferase